MFIPISENWLSIKFFVDLTSLTTFERLTLLLLSNILFFISFRFIYSLLKDVIGCILRTFRGVFK